jgi:GrpB-like predicted nucleotidyltransferase (UPF0157 family)
MSTDSNKDYPAWAIEQVEIVAFQPDWLDRGQAECIQLAELLLPFGVSQVEHIGSTAVAGLPAKPIIDIMGSIKAYDAIDGIIERLSPGDWHYVPPELDNRPWRRFFIKVRANKRAAHLHLIFEGEERWKQQLAFRDRLRNDDRLMRQYAQLKLELSERFKDDREAYTEAKTSFISAVLKDSI